MEEKLSCFNNVRKYFLIFHCSFFFSAPELLFKTDTSFRFKRGKTGGKKMFFLQFPPQCLFFTCEILTGGLLLMKRQRRSTLEPTKPACPSSTCTVCPSVPGRAREREEWGGRLRLFDSCGRKKAAVEPLKCAELSKVIDFSGVRAELRPKLWD